MVKLLQNIRHIVQTHKHRVAQHEDLRRVRGREDCKLLVFVAIAPLPLMGKTLTMAPADSS